jgi:hypothetical protein
MMGRQDRDQRQLFYEFSLDEMIPTDHLLRRINVFATAVASMSLQLPVRRRSPATARNTETHSFILSLPLRY